MLKTSHELARKLLTLPDLVIGIGETGENIVDFEVDLVTVRHTVVRGISAVMGRPSKAEMKPFEEEYERIENRPRTPVTVTDDIMENRRRFSDAYQKDTKAYLAQFTD